MTEDTAPTADYRPWLTAYAEGVEPDIPEPTQSLTDLLTASADRYGSQDALDFFGSTTTYQDLTTQVAKGAEALRRLGVARGDRVGLVLPNCPQHVVAFYAILRIGAVVVEHNPLYTADELATQLADHRAKVVICWENTAMTIHSIQDRTSVEMIVTVNLAAALPLSKRLALLLPIPMARRMRKQMRGPVPQGSRSWEALVAEAPALDKDVPGPVATDVALLQYTGGTTGIPKGAILTHRNLVANALMGRDWAVGVRNGEESFLAVLPLFHAYGLTLCLTTAIMVGAKIVLMPRFELNQVIATIHRCRPTFLPGVPTLYERLATAADQGKCDLSSVKFCISGAMSLPESVVTAWERHAGGFLVEGYGMTETSPIAVGNPISDQRRPGSIGVPFPSTYAKIVDPEDPAREFPSGKPGELLIKGPQVFSGYWERPEETKATLLPDGWIRTGDLAVMDQDGFITLVDRIKELIITGGFNVYPSEVEKVLRGYPGVLDVAVVGLPARPSGEHVAAALVVSDEVTIDPDTLRAWCRERIAGYKVPRKVIVIEELPRSQVGKVLRRLVRERLLESDSPSA